MKSSIFFFTIFCLPLLPLDAAASLVGCRLRRVRAPRRLGRVIWARLCVRTGQQAGNGQSMWPTTDYQYIHGHHLK